MDIFISETCPYCRKVLDYLHEHNIEFTKHDVANSSEFEKLVELGGIEQVPFLFDKNNNIKMYDSDKIIDYLSKI